MARKGALMSRCDFVALVDVLTVFAEEAQHFSGDAKDEDKQELHGETLCSSRTFECVCVLIASEAFRDHGILLWSRMLQLTLMFKRQNTSVYNAVNCILQSIRSATLSICLHDDGDGDATASGVGRAESLQTLRVVIGVVEALVRPPNVGDVASLYGDSVDVSFAPVSFSSDECSRILLTLVDCGNVNACLAVLSSLAAESESSESVDSEAIVTVSLAMRLLHIQFVHNKTFGQEFSRCVASPLLRLT